MNKEDVQGTSEGTSEKYTLRERKKVLEGRPEMCRNMGTEANDWRGLTGGSGSLEDTLLPCVHYMLHMLHMFFNGPSALQFYFTFI